MRAFISLIVVLCIGCTKELENQVEELRQANLSLVKQLNNLISDMDSYEAQIAILEFQLNNPKCKF